MSDKTEQPEMHGDSFIQRWSRRKHQQQREKSPAPAKQETVSDKTPDPAIQEADLPPIDTLQPDSEVSMFFNEGISEKLRQKALRKLFHFNKFNVVDGLDDYAEDYTIFQPLYNLYSSREDIQKLAGAIAGDNETDTTTMDASDTDTSNSVAQQQETNEAGNMTDTEITREDKEV